LVEIFILDEGVLAPMEAASFYCFAQNGNGKKDVPNNKRYSAQRDPSSQ